MWQELAALIGVSDLDRHSASLFYDIFRRKGYLPIAPADALDLSDQVICAFYSLFEDPGDRNLPFHSSWMRESSFCFINVRATGKNGKHGNFLSAAKLLPCLRSNAIHLGPFTEYSFQVIYSVMSVRSISDNVTDNDLERRGFSRERQLDLFINAAHLLGKRVGFDIEPHVAQFSYPVLEKPEIFAWIKLDASKNLSGGMTLDEMMLRVNQERIAAEVKSISSEMMASASMTTFEHEESDSPDERSRKKTIFGTIASALIAKGYWPVNPQVWCGDGIPSYREYNFVSNHPVFNFYDREGILRNEWAHHILAPFMFTYGLKEHCVPSASRISPNEHAREYFNAIFDYWRDRFHFDFIRYDSLDHIFDSLWNGSYSVSSADRIPPEALKHSVERVRSHLPHIGTLAERMGTNYQDYAWCGFDLILGNDMMRRIDSQLLCDMFGMQRSLALFNCDRNKKISVCFATDTHDTGDPNLWGKPLVEIMGAERMLLRNFVARFHSSGEALRPRYESIGCQDLSFGLYQSNVRDINLNWLPDRSYSAQYHVIDDVYDDVVPLLRRGELSSYHVGERICWWIITCKEEALVALISFETADGVAVDGKISVHLPFERSEYRTYNFNDGTFRTNICLNGEALVSAPRYLGYALLKVKRLG